MAAKNQELLDRFVAGVRAASENAAYTENTTDEGGVRYDIRKSDNGDTFVDVDPSIYDETDGPNVAQVIAQIISHRFHNLIEANGQTIRINATTNAEWRRSEEATYLRDHNPIVYQDKIKAIGNADEILRAARKWVGEARKHENKKNIVEFARGNVVYRVGQNGYIADVIVATKKDGSALLYDLVNIHEIKITEAPLSRADENRPSSEGVSAKDNITHSEKNVKNQSRDADNPATPTISLQSTAGIWKPHSGWWMKRLNELLRTARSEARMTNTSRITRAIPRCYVFTSLSTIRRSKTAAATSAAVLLLSRCQLCQYFLSRERYWIASLMCGERMISL